VAVHAVSVDVHGRPDVIAAMGLLVREYGCVNVMLECGEELLRTSFAAGIVDQALVHIAPGEGPIRRAAGEGWAVLRQHVVGVDTELLLSRDQA